jgi:DMSO/TMAO reductase YedYZ molybdopterin-dependent catalytic subunit
LGLISKGECMCSCMRLSILLAVISTAVLFLIAQSPETKLTIRGDVSKPGAWSVDDLKRQFAKEIQTVQFSSGEDKKQKTATGIPLLSLIKASEIKTEKSTRHHDLSFIVILEARDSLRAIFSLAEIIQQSAQPQLWLVWEMNGKPLTDKEAPLRLVSTNGGASRALYGISSLTMVDGVKLANQLAPK